MGRKKGDKRGWCFTINNYTDDDLHHLDDSDEKQVKYFICGGEVGEQGTPHLQGYIYFHNAKSFDDAKKFIGSRANIRPADGDALQNRAYCSKDCKFLEYGTLPKQGARHDISVARDRLKKGDSIFDIIEETSSYQAARHLELLYKYQTMRPPQYQERYVLWITSKYQYSGLAKAIQGEDDYYIAPPGLMHWDAYTGQKTIIVSINEDPHHQLIRLVSPIPCQLNTKGGIRWLQPTTTKIVVTSRKVPLLFYEDEDSVDLVCFINEQITI